MKTFASIFVPLALVGASTLAHAQAASDIVVEGVQEPTASDREQARQFVDGLYAETPTGQAARWVSNFCPSASGLDESQAGYLFETIKREAETVDLKTLDRRCNSTLVIFFSSDPDELANALSKKYVTSLRQDGYSAFQTFINSKQPVRWVTVTNRCGGNDCAATNSRITKSTQPRLEAMLVIVDARQIGQYSLRELSDYLAMVVLAVPQSTGPWPEDSVMSMFSRPRAEGESFAMTRMDRSYLNGLYNSRESLGGETQRTVIAEAVALAKAP